MNRIVRVGAFFLFAFSAHAWDRHATVTGHLLHTVSLSPASVTYVPLETALRQTFPQDERKSRVGFLTHYLLNKGYGFPTKLAEANGKPLEAKAVLAAYADEPDEGPDQELFAPDQYPELWNEDLPYISKKTGLGSRGFRHMYFPGNWNWREPISSFQIPNRPLGEAPDRAVVFYEISRAFFQADQSYWGYRFLSWSLHYIEDLFQPFHVWQTPNKAFIRLKWKGLLPGFDVPATAEQITYYHLSYELWMAEQMDSGKGELIPALAESELGPAPDSALRPYVLKEVVAYAGSKATEVGRRTAQVFPAFTPTEETNAEKFVGSAAWQSAIQQNGAMEPLIQVTRDLFSRMGQVCRAWIQKACKKEKNPEH